MPEIHTASQLFLKEEQANVVGFKSKIRALDDMLGGGPLTGQIYEIFGNAGNLDPLILNIIR